MDLPRKRKRGTILTFQGLNKLEKAIKIREYSENNSKRFTLDYISSQTGLDSHTLCKIFNCNVRVDKKSLVKCFKAFNLVLEADDYQSPLPVPLVNPETHSTQFIQPLQPEIQPDGDYNLAPKVSVFYGRTAELVTLNQWIQVNRCQLIMVLGMGGMGKTSLIAKLMAGFTNSEFKYVIWRFLRSASLSLYHAPTAEETLTDLIHIVSHQQAVDLPKFPDQLISKSCAK